jgi:hypothetical protein
MTAPKLTFARRVTRRHGELFVAAWLEASSDSGAGIDAFNATKVIEWPSGEFGDPRQARFQNIEDEILERTFEIARPAIVTAFVTAAREVIERERARRTKADGK